MNNFIIHKAGSRGVADFGWLISNHSFSFGSYQNPERMGFGKLRVLNDDVIQPSTGFDTHPHNNMEIITIPLSGALRHKDSTGREAVIQKGEVQIMTAGTGIFHSEYNASDSEACNFLQLWILPKQIGVTPGYHQQSFDASARKNKWQLVVAANAEMDALPINQDARLWLSDLDEGKSISHQITTEGHCVYLLVIEGEINMYGEALGKRDAIGITASHSIDISASTKSEILLIEVPK